MSLPIEELVQDVGQNKLAWGERGDEVSYSQIRKSRCVVGWKRTQDPSDRPSTAGSDAPILGHRYASFAHLTGREDPPPHWPSGCSTEPLRDESNRAAATKAEMNRCSELTALQSFNERAAITKFSAVGTWESISISPPFFLKRQWLRVHSAHETSDQWLLAVAIVCLAPPSIDNVSRGAAGTWEKWVCQTQFYFDLDRK